MVVLGEGIEREGHHAAIGSMESELGIVLKGSDKLVQARNLKREVRREMTR